MTNGLPYRPGGWVPVPAWRRGWPLAQQEFLAVFRTRWGVAVFCACLIPAAVRLFVLMILNGVVDFGAGFKGQLLSRSQAFAQWDPGRAEFYVESVVNTFPGLPVLVTLTAWVTAGAVARDRATAALELLWTRGITPWQYVFARWCGSLLLLLLITVGGPLFLWIAAALLADDWSQAASTLPFLAPTLAGLLLATAAWTACCVMVSALCASRVQAVVAWCLLVLGSAAVANVSAVVFREPAARSWLSLWDAGAVLARACAGVATRGAPVAPAAWFCGGLLVVLGVLARRRLALREAVG